MHASTFGGNPLAMAAGIATVQTIEEENLLDNVEAMSERFRSHFATLAEELPIISEIRTRGMMIGVELTIPSTPAVGKCMEKGLLINATQGTVIRLLPAVNISAEEVDEGFNIIADVLREMASEAS
jgi:acetylornithine/succinyldiaminopimelate/putrescine aminotransferase